MLNPSRLLPALLAMLLVFCGGCTKQAKLNRHLANAEKYFNAGDFEKAKIEYINVLRLSSTNLTAARHLGTIFYEDESAMDALQLLNFCKKNDPQDVESRSKLSRLYFNLGGFNQAREEAQFVLDRDPANETALFVLIDGVRHPQEIKPMEQVVEKLRQKSGDKPVFHVAAGFLALKGTNRAVGEAEFKKAIEMDPKNSTGHFALGSLYWSSNKNQEAAVELKTAASLSPIRSNRRLRFAEFELANNAPNEARAALKEITQKAPDYVPAWMLLAKVETSEKHLPEALAALDRILAQNPNHAEAVSLRAQIRVAEQKYDLAIADLERLLNVFPKAAPIRYQLATTLLQKRDLTRAVSALNQAIASDTNHIPSILLLAELNIRRGEAPLAVTSLTELIKRQPRSERAYSLLGSAYQNLNRLDEAIAVYKTMVQLFPDSGGPLLLLGNAYRQAGRLEEARKTLDQALAKNPEDNTALTQLVEMDIQAKKFDDAIARVQAQIAKFPKSPQPLFLLANIRRMQKKFPEAQALLEKVIEMNPEHIGAYLSMAALYVEQNNVPSAIEKLNGILSKNPKDISALSLLATIYSQAGQPKKAEEIYNKLLAINPNSILALNNLASYYSDSAQIDKAYDLGRRVEELLPTDPRVADTYGWILSQRGETALALNLLRESDRAMPGTPEVLAHLGLTYYNAGNEKSAYMNLTNALTLSTNFPNRAEAEQAVAILKIDSATADSATRAKLEQRLAAQPADVVALERLSAIYRKEGNSDKLLPLYEKALAANPKNGMISARLAVLESERRNGSKALELARNARNLAPQDPEVALMGGRIALESTDPKDHIWALSVLQEANQQRPGNAETLYNLALAYFTQGRFSETEITLKEALKASTEFPHLDAAKRLLEWVQIDSDPARAVNAQSQIGTVLKTDPNYTPALVAQAISSEQRGDKAAAQNAWEKVMARYPAFAPAVRSLAILLGDRPADPKAFQYASRARELYPDDPLVGKALGLAAYQKRDYSRSAQLLGESAAKSANDAEIQFYLGMSQYQLKQTASAKVALQKAIALAPNAPFAADAKRTLSELK